MSIGMYKKIAVIILGLIMSGLGVKYFYIDPKQEEAAAFNQEKLKQEKAKLDGVKRFMNQGNGTIRKPGTSGFRRYGSNSF
jgi:hypothetical protein